MLVSLHCPLLALTSTLVPLAYSASAYAVELPPLQSANLFEENDNLDLSRYWYAEKLDGVRGYWNGTQLLTRQGHLIHAPEWFVRDLPNIPMEGELWISHGRFAELSGIVRQKEPDERWRLVSFNLFDLPKNIGSYKDRRSQLELLVQDIQQPHIRSIPVNPIVSVAELKQILRLKMNEGAEGLMLYDTTAIYMPNRNNGLLKYKLYQDAEAYVVGYNAGKGRFTGAMGSLIVENMQGVRFNIGSGFDLADRRNPPPIGSIITYRYNGLTKHGKPRFARFHRIRGSDE